MTKYVGKKVPLKQDEDEDMEAYLRYDFNRKGSMLVLEKLYQLLKDGFQTITEVISRTVLTVTYVPARLLMTVYSPMYHLYDRYEWLKDMVKLPSPKRIIYQGWFAQPEIAARVVAGKVKWELKVKKEAGKIAKDPRLYGTGESGAIIDRVVPEVVKIQQKQVLNYRHIRDLNLDFESRYWPAQSPEDSCACFEWLSSVEPGCFRMVYSGDDSLASYCTHEGVVIPIEGDLSACDSGNGPGAAYLIWRDLAQINPVAADMLVAALSEPAKLVNPYNAEEYVVFRPESVFMYSGTPLTVIENNSIMRYGGYCTYSELARRIRDGVELDYKSIGACFRFGFSKAGHIITLEERSDFCEASFLKRAYFEGRSFLLLGSYLRSFGVIRGLEDKLDHTQFGLTSKELKSKTDDELFEILGHSLLATLVHEPGNIILNALRRRFGVAVHPVYINDRALRHRYKVEDHELLILEGLIADLRAGQIISCEALDRIFHVDYGA
jgi:hypothetical protein